MTATVLLLESETSLRKVVTASLEQLGLRILPSADPEHAERLIRERDPDVLVLELEPPAGDSGKLIEAYRRAVDEGAVLLTTTARPQQDWRRRYEPEAVIYKPFDVRVLARQIRRLIGER